MAEITLPAQPPRRIHFDWVLPVLFRPRPTFKQITEQIRSVWLTPILILMAAVLIYVAISGRLVRQAALSGGFEFPPGFEYYTPEQQAQFQQTAEARSGPVFVYVLPAIGGIIGVWAGWLIVGGLLHLALTLLGGRGSTLATMNIVAWASLPIAVRLAVQVIFMLAESKLVPGEGLVGFAPDSGGIIANAVAAFLVLIDIYLIWQMVLMVIGIRQSTGLSMGRAVVSVILAMGLVVVVQAVFGVAGTMLTSLNIIPFF